jgi:predicted TIM-barrel fold metal-dependent hydrolase
MRRCPTTRDVHPASHVAIGGPVTGLRIVDPHFHLMDVENNPYPWLEPDAQRPDIYGGRDAQLRHVFLADDWLLATEHQNVAKAVHVQANWDFADPVAETRWLAAIAETYGVPTGVVGFLNLAMPDAEVTLAEHLQFPFLRGIRQILNWHDREDLRFTDRPDYMQDSAWLRGFSLLSKYGLSFDTQIYHWQFDDTVTVARQFPDVQIILNHTGMPLDRSGDGIDAWSAAMVRLAQAPNVSVKISGLGLGQDRWSTESLREVIVRAIDAFGTDRCMFASNFPVERLWVDYDTIINTFSAICADLSYDERQDLFGRNAERIYRV